MRPYGLEATQLLCTGVDCHALLQEIFPTQGSNPCLMSPALASRFFTTRATWKPQVDAAKHPTVLKKKKKKESPAQYVDSAKSRNPGLKIKVKSEQKKLFKIPISLRQDTFQCNYSKLQHLHKQYRIMRANVQNGVPELIL